MTDRSDTTGHYNEVRVVARLPRQVARDARVVSHGYAAEVGGIGSSAWFFFDRLEPALVFGRSARQSTRITSYGVYRGAEEVLESDRILHVIYAGLGRDGDERKHLIRWAEVCDPCSAHWPPTPGICENPAAHKAAGSRHR